MTGAWAGILLAAVPALGVTTLLPAGFRQPGDSPVAEVSSSPFSFDAPTATLHKVKPGKGENHQATARADNPVTLGDWRYTAVTTQELAGLLALQTAEEFLSFPASQQPFLFGLLAFTAPGWAHAPYNELVAVNFLFAVLDSDDRTLNLLVFAVLLQAIAQPPSGGPVSPHT